MLNSGGDSGSGGKNKNPAWREKPMRGNLIVTLGVILCLAPVPVFAQKKPALATQKDKVSYSIGLDIGRRLKAQDIDVNPALMADGIKDGMGSGKPRMTDDEIRQIMIAFQTEMRTRQMEKVKKLADKNLKEGQAFLAGNSKKAGVNTTASGLQYKVIKEGDGKTPTLSDTVIAHYRGTLLDGTEFDSSYKRGEPATFPVTGVIPGWTEVLQLMHTGAKYEVYIPSNLGYGEQGAGSEIGPNATLIFEIELIGVK
jgi:FKBP-type peptidyl-prolyl cis-trans isomerase FklB